jgi:hypothetical protein
LFEIQGNPKSYFAESDNFKMGWFEDLKFNNDGFCIKRKYFFSDEYLKQDMIFIAFDFQKEQYFLFEKKPFL